MLEMVERRFSLSRWWWIISSVCWISLSVAALIVVLPEELSVGYESTLMKYSVLAFGVILTAVCMGLVTLWIIGIPLLAIFTLANPDQRTRYGRRIAEMLVLYVAISVMILMLVAQIPAD